VGKYIVKKEERLTVKYDCCAVDYQSVTCITRLTI
jgi:hypothetical protein